MAVPARRVPRERPVGPRRRPAPRPRPRIVAPAPTHRRRRVPFLLFSLVLVAATVVGLVSAQALVAQDSFRVAELTARAERLEGGYGRLRLHLAELSSPDRIATAARRAGLVLPEEVEILRLPAARTRPLDPPVEPDTVLALKEVLGGDQ